MLTLKKKLNKRKSVDGDGRDWDTNHVCHLPWSEMSPSEGSRWAVFLEINEVVK